MLSKHGTGKRGSPRSAEYKTYLKHLKTKYGLRSDKYTVVSNIMKEVICSEWDFFCNGGFVEEDEERKKHTHFIRRSDGKRVPITTWNIRITPTLFYCEPTGAIGWRIVDVPARS
jgi:hypothetical protein